MRGHGSIILYQFKCLIAIISFKPSDIAFTCLVQDHVDDALDLYDYQRRVLSNNSSDTSDSALSVSRHFVQSINLDTSSSMLRGRTVLHLLSKLKLLATCMTCNIDSLT